MLNQRSMTRSRSIRSYVLAGEKRKENYYKRLDGCLYRRIDDVKQHLLGVQTSVAHKVRELLKQRPRLKNKSGESDTGEIHPDRELGDYRQQERLWLRVELIFFVHVAVQMLECGRVGVFRWPVGLGRCRRGAHVDRESIEMKDIFTNQPWIEQQ